MNVPDLCQMEGGHKGIVHMGELDPLPFSLCKDLSRHVIVGDDGSQEPLGADGESGGLDLAIDRACYGPRLHVDPGYVPLSLVAHGDQDSFSV